MRSQRLHTHDSPSGLCRPYWHRDAECGCCPRLVTGITVLLTARGAVTIDSRLVHFSHAALATTSESRRLRQSLSTVCACGISTDLFQPAPSIPGNGLDVVHDKYGRKQTPCIVLLYTLCFYKKTSSSHTAPPTPVPPHPPLATLPPSHYHTLNSSIRPASTFSTPPPPPLSTFHLHVSHPALSHLPSGQGRGERLEEGGAVQKLARHPFPNFLTTFSVGEVGERGA